MKRIIRERLTWKGCEFGLQENTARGTGIATVLAVMTAFTLLDATMPPLKAVMSLLTRL